MDEPKIISATIGPMPRPMPEGMCDPMPTVSVKFDDGRKADLFTFYPDELTFAEAEFIGLTEVAARDLHRQKDAEFLRA